MESNSVRFADFECLLLRLGFERKTTAGTQRLYEYRTQNDTWILLPDYTPEEPVRTPHLRSARRLLAERGIAEEAPFDRMPIDIHEEADCDSEETKTPVMQTV